MAKTSSPVIAQALAELRSAITALDAAATQQANADRSGDRIKSELALMQDDRARLANDLDAALARLNRYDQISADLSKRIERALTAVRVAIGDHHENGDA